MFGARAALNLLVALVVAGVAAEDDTAPVAGFAASCDLLGSEDDRLGGCSLGDEFTSALGYESRLRLLVTLDYGAGFYGKFGAIGYIYPSFEQVGTLLQSLFSGEDEFLVAVADGRSTVL